MAESADRTKFGFVSILRPLKIYFRESLHPYRVEQYARLYPFIYPSVRPTKNIYPRLPARPFFRMRGASHAVSEITAHTTAWAVKGNGAMR
jgi:hypothetical protein